MNAWQEIELELRKLRPARVAPDLLARIEQRIAAEPAPQKIIAPARFRISRLALGCGLAAAAAFIVFVNVDTHSKKSTSVASAPRTDSNGSATANYEPQAVTQVVYHRRDEGLVFPPGAQTPARRIRLAKRETFEWRDPRTGAQLRVSYPEEQVTLIPVSGQ